MSGALGTRPGLVVLGVPGFVRDAPAAVPCRTSPDAYFVEGVKPAAARALCSGCGYLVACRAFALARPGLVGVWGGTTWGERGRMRRAAVVERGPPAGGVKAGVSLVRVRVGNRESR
ncbi:WhiB family transcriptional regulator [Streptomyces sp. Amel2xC10]|uniref:WhiB family transcriptional regulator n=1 Tax=Streptomyces sp. Amel2xC10 TaxID=1305826 RepID=UPI000A085A04|nr:Transcription factor WhiB [Streptomyces sp. Amel2xC10]